MDMQASLAAASYHVHRHARADIARDAQMRPYSAATWAAGWVSGAASMKPPDWRRHNVA
jgi:hypothetical protein